MPAWSRSISSLVDAFVHDLKYALRGLRARPAFAATVVLTIALGIGANATMFGIVDRLLFRAPDHIRDPERVVQIEAYRNGSEFVNSSFSYAAYTDYRDRPGAFESVAATWSGKFFPLGRGPTASRVAGALVSASLFPMLGVRPALGRFFTADEDDADHPQTVAVISYGFWQRHFGGRANALGQQLDIGTQHYTIVGVAPKGFTGTELTDVEVWLPITAPSGLRFDNSPGWVKHRTNSWLHIVARIKPGVDARLAAEQATAVHRAALRQRLAENPSSAQYIKPDSERVVLASLIPGRAIPSASDRAPGRSPGGGGGAAKQDVKVSELLGVVSMITLIIACANVANLLLVRAFNRRREIGLRLALGVTRARLVSQLLVEGLLLSVLGGAGALLVAHWTSQSVRTLLLGANAWTSEAVDGRLLAFTAVATIATGLVTSLVPALQAARTDLAQTLKQGVREGGGQRSPLRTALLVVQAGLAILLLAGAGLFIRSVHNVNGLPLGLDFDHALVADVSYSSVGLTNDQGLRLYREFVTRARALPGVKSAAITVGLPLSLNWGVDVNVQGRVLPKVRYSPAQFAVTPEYFATLGIPVVAGRRFTDADRAGAAPVMMINQTMARLYWPNENPLGMCAQVGSDTVPCATIVGVVGNTVQQNLSDGMVPQLYRPLDQLPSSYTDATVSFFGYQLVVGTRGDAARLAEPVRRAMQSVAPIVPYANVQPMRDLLGRRMRAWDLGAKVFSAFGVLALVLAAVGLYSVLAFSLAHRVHEFGVRMALGARPADLVRLTLSVGLAPIIAGIAGGMFLTLLLGKFVASLLFNVSPHDPGTLGGVCAILLLTGVAASLIPALRATRVDPATVLRSE